VFFDHEDAAAAVKTATRHVDTDRLDRADNPPLHATAMFVFDKEQDARNPNAERCADDAAAAKRRRQQQNISGNSRACGVITRSFIAHKAGTYQAFVSNRFLPVPGLCSTVRQCVWRDSRRRSADRHGMVSAMDMCLLLDLDCEAFLADPGTAAVIGHLARKYGVSTSTIVFEDIVSSGTSTTPFMRELWVHPQLAVHLASTVEDRTMHDALKEPLNAWLVRFFKYTRWHVASVCLPPTPSQPHYMLPPTTTTGHPDREGHRGQTPQSVRKKTRHLRRRYCADRRSGAP
jgi:hypothetical protein